jgi:hypothetical protein
MPARSQQVDNFQRNLCCIWHIREVVGEVIGIVNEPWIGEEKRRDLSGVFVHKFKLNN